MSLPTVANSMHESTTERFLEFIAHKRNLNYDEPGSSWTFETYCNRCTGESIQQEEIKFIRDLGISE